MPRLFIATTLGMLMLPRPAPAKIVIWRIAYTHLLRRGRNKHLSQEYVVVKNSDSSSEVGTSLMEAASVTPSRGG